MMNPNDVNFVSHNALTEAQSTPFQSKLYINGCFCEGSSGELSSRYSPAFGHLVGQYAQANEADALTAIDAARKAFDSGVWSDKTGAERSNILLKIADGIESQLEEFALLESMETGKPLQQAQDEIVGSIDIWRYAATLARNLHGDTYHNLGSNKVGMTVREPLGVVSCITPWNFPFLILSQKLPFALAAGCTAIVKPAELTSGTTIKLATILESAGVPAGVVNILIGSGRTLGAPMATDPRVDMVTFTGSTSVGQRVAAQASQSMKKISMELGGKNPQIIMPDCDWEAAVDAVVFGVYFNAGECCNSGSRVLVHESIADDFLAAVVEKSKLVKVGNPLADGVRVGPMIHEGHLDEVLGYIAKAEEQGDSLLLGGQRIEHDTGLYLAPTIIRSANSGNVICHEEIFGPVLTALTFTDLDEAIAIANSTEFGLSASIWSKNIDNCLTASKKIQAGTVWINTFMDGFPELPFGGYKQSGLGRELGRLSVEEYTEIKTIQMHIGERTAMWVSSADPS